MAPPHNNPRHHWPAHRLTFPRSTRRHILTRDPECQLGYDGCTITSTEADHITSVAEAIALGWTPDQINDPDNGQGVCPPCHQRKTHTQAAAGRARSRQQRQRPKPKHPGLI